MIDDLIYSLTHFMTSSLTRKGTTFSFVCSGESVHNFHDMQEALFHGTAGDPYLPLLNTVLTVPCSHELQVLLVRLALLAIVTNPEQRSD